MMRTVKMTILILVVLTSSVSFCFSATYYISPRGRDFANGKTEETPFRSFARAFGRMASGDELILLDGIYSVRAETGIISYDDSADPMSAQPPSGKDPSATTLVRAKNPGKVIVDGGGGPGLLLGRSVRKDSYITIKGIRFEGGGSLWNTSYITIKECAFHSEKQGGGGVFTIGVNERTHSQGNSYNIIEDCWIWGRERIIASNYNSDNNIWRRVVIRGDGCSSAACAGPGNPNVGFTIYDSKNCSAQNVIVIDRVLGGGFPYGSFATAQHTAGAHFLGPNEWLGCIALKSEDGGFVFGADSANDNTHTLRNIVSWDSGLQNINIPHQAKNIFMENITTGVSGFGCDNVRIAPEVQGGVVRNIIAYHGGRYGVNSPIQPTYCDVFKSGARYLQTQCRIGDTELDPLKAGNPPSLKYLVRIEEGSPLKGKGYDGGDYGANVIKRYGVDGSHYGDYGYNALTDADLWPWPNEDRIKADMSESSKRGFCADGMTLTKYIWEYLGNPIPEEIYGKVERTVK